MPKGRNNNINCTVETCDFHGSDNCCHASSIKVGTEYALDKTETFCSTYKHKR
ncbi:MAG: DUF1540 domain-containing protein [Oscillospiraceae bacterium]|nr:DUF1540 domain-containing protein [Oscillospiraceae bacterium]